MNKPDNQTTSTGPAMDENIEGLVIFFLQEGCLRHAIEVYQDETGASRGEARRAVSELADRNGVRPKWFALWR